MPFAPTFASVDATAGRPLGSADPVTILPAAPAQGAPVEAGVTDAITALPAPEVTRLPPAADAATIGPTGVMMSLGAPVRFGDGGFRAGDQVGPRYTIIKLLGTGGMGAVYHAFDQELGVGVAIKVIRPGN